MRKQRRKQVKAYKRQLRKAGVPASERQRLVREFKKELKKQERQVIRQI